MIYEVCMKGCLGKDVLKIYSKFTGEQIENEITLRHGCSLVNLLYIFRTPLDGCFCINLRALVEDNSDNRSMLTYTHFSC